MKNQAIKKQPHLKGLSKQSIMAPLPLRHPLSSQRHSGCLQYANQALMTSQGEKVKAQNTKSRISLVIIGQGTLNLPSLLHPNKYTRQRII